MKIGNFLKFVLTLTLIAAFLVPQFLVFAQDSISDIEEELTTAKEERGALEEELKKLEDEIAEYEKDITKTEQEKKTLQNQIYLLRQKISQLDLQIYQSNLMIEDLTLQIKDTEGSIVQTGTKIDGSRGKLAAIMQTIYEEDQRSLIEILLSEKELSDFFDNLLALETLNSQTQELLKDIKSLKTTLENQKQLQDTNKSDLESVVKLKTLQKQESETTRKEADYYLKLTEAEYQASLQKKTEAEKRAVEIRARIFELIGVPQAPTFGEAYEIAKYVEGITGVRPALLLAVLTQESNIGKNVGQCYLRDTKTGSGVVTYNGKEVERVMKPMGLSGRKGDVDSFLTITAELGRDPYNTPVSCPMSYGYGGAMGPAQFIPTTWMIYRNKVKEITGKAADPWNIKDAFIAAALYLADYGATKQTYNSEWKAAMIYFSGTTNLAYRFYGDSVMKITAKYEEDIRQIEGI